jgi:hypothetical protein
MRANTGAQTAEKLPAGAATKAAAASSSSASSSSSAAAATDPAPPPLRPRSAPSALPPAVNLVRGSRRRAPIGQRNAPRHNVAARRRRAGAAPGFPAEPAVSGSRESTGGRGPLPRHPERADAGAGAAPGWSRAGRSEPDTRRAEEEPSHLAGGGGGRGKGDAAGGADGAGAVTCLRLTCERDAGSG